MRTLLLIVAACVALIVIVNVRACPKTNPDARSDAGTSSEASVTYDLASSGTNTGADTVEGLSEDSATSSDGLVLNTADDSSLLGISSILQVATTLDIPTTPPTAQRTLQDTASVSDGTDPTTLFHYGDLTQAIGTLEDEGCSVSVTIIDLENGLEFDYRPDVEHYPASSIKGPYCMALLQERVETGQTSLSVVQTPIQSVLIYSDNDAYANLRASYGAQLFIDWCGDAGIDLSGSLYSNPTRYYPLLTSRKLCTMWSHGYSWLSGQSEAAKMFTQASEQRVVSPIADALPNVTTWAKAGWFPYDTTGGVTTTTADAGIVLDEHPYAIAVMTSAAEDFDAVADIVYAADEVHADLV